MAKTLPQDSLGTDELTLVPARRAAAVVDTVHGADGVDDDALATALAAVLEQFGEHDVLLTRDDVASLRAVAASLRAVLVATDRNDAAELIDGLLATFAGRPRLLRHEGWDWHLHVDSGVDAPWAEWLASSAALALASMLVGASDVPWGECAAVGCERVFVHDGRGAARRYCSATCATRERVRRHRAVSRGTRQAAPARGGATATA